MEINKKIKGPTLDTIYTYTLALLPILFMTGPFLSGLAVTIISLAGLFFYFKFKKIFIEKFFFTYFLIFCFYLIFSSILSPVFSDSIVTSLVFIRYLFFFSFLFYIFKKVNYIKFNTISLILVGFLSFIFIDSIFQYYFGQNLIGIKKYHEIRISSFFKDELILGAFTIKILPLIISITLLSKLNYKNFLIFYVIIISMFLIILSAERTAFFMYFMFVLLIYFKPIFGLKYKIKVLIFIFLSMLVLVLTNNNLKNRIIFETYSQIAAHNKINIFSQQHTSHLLTAHKIFKDNMIFGAGPKSFRYLCSKEEYYVNEDSCSTHPHNYLMQILSEIGIIGLLFFIVFYIWLIRVYYSSNKNEVMVLSAGLMSFYFPLIPSVNFFGSWSTGLMSISLGMLLYLLSKNNNQNANL